MFDIREYIRESNAIERVHDDDAVETSMDAWEYLQEQDALTNTVIQQAHRRILSERQPEIAGEYRDVNVRVGNDIPPHHEEVPGEMDDLLETTPDNPLEAIEWHVEFERIHPFADGNGRIGRLLYAWHCQEMGETPIMWRADDVQGYYSLFASK